MGMGGKKVTVGYKYLMGVQLAVSHGPVDALRELIAGERSAWTGSVTGNSTILVNQPNLFGGEDREGGLVGAIDVCMGAQTQGKNPYLQSVISGPLPAYRGLLTTVFHNLSGSGGFMWSAMNPYFKSPWWRVYRTFAGWSRDTVWYPEKCRIGSRDMNPIHIVYECLTNLKWGMGYSPSDIDDASFRAAADKLYEENFGISLMWMEQTSINEFVNMVLKHFDGALRTDVRTGLFKMRLIRNDYVVANLSSLDESNIISMNSFQRVAWGDTANEITVVFTDREQLETNITVQDLASIEAQGRVIPATKEYVGIRDPELAGRVGVRDLNNASTPLAKVSLTCNQTAWNWDITDVFRLYWPRLGINGVPFRIIKIDKGELASGVINIDALEDIFGLPTNAYVEQQPPGWVDPIQPPIPVTAAKVFEAPYYDLVAAFSAADLAYMPTDVAFAEVASAAPTADSYGINLWYSPNGAVAYTQVSTGDFTPSALLVGGMVRNEGPVTFTVSSPLNLGEELLNQYFYIDNEAFWLTAYNPLTLVMSARRAVLDTVPATHLSGSRLWFMEEGATYDPTQRVANETAFYKPLTRTGKGILALADATAVSITFNGRAMKPYPPGNVKVNNAYYPVNVGDGMTLTWSHRDRLQQTTGLTDFKTGNIGPEAGTTYTVQVYSGATLKRTVTGIAGTSWSYTDALVMADGDIQTLRLVLGSAVAGRPSWQTHDITVERWGLGFHLGEQLGGTVPA